MEDFNYTNKNKYKLNSERERTVKEKIKRIKKKQKKEKGKSKIKKQKKNIKKWLLIFITRTNKFGSSLSFIRLQTDISSSYNPFLIYKQIHKNQFFNTGISKKIQNVLPEFHKNALFYP